MKPFLVVFALCGITTSLFAESGSRYIVMTRPAARERQITLLREGETPEAEHEVRPFRYFDGFAATLTESEAAALRRSPYVRYLSPVVERHLNDSVSAPFAGETAGAPLRGETNIS